LANSETRTFFRTILPEFGIIGRPDILDCRDGKNPVIVERKYTRKIPVPPWPDHRVQVGTYMMGLERLGFHPKRGILEYVKRDSKKEHMQYTVLLDPKLRKQVLMTAEAVLRLLQGKQEPKATRNPRQCVPCRFVDSCKWKPPSA